MGDISKVVDFKSGDRNAIVEALKRKSVKVADWDESIKNYEPTLHKIVKDTEVLKDKIRSDGTVEKSARIYVGLEKLLCKRVSEFTFAIPVKRIYSNTNNEDGTPNDVRQAFLRSIWSSAS